jgi:hypothetical protein
MLLSVGFPLYPLRSHQGSDIIPAMKVMLALCLAALAVIGGMTVMESGRPSFFFTYSHTPSMFDLLPRR